MLNSYRLRTIATDISGNHSSSVRKTDDDWYIYTYFLLSHGNFNNVSLVKTKTFKN